MRPDTSACSLYLGLRQRAVSIMSWPSRLAHYDLVPRRARSLRPKSLISALYMVWHLRD